MSDGIRTRDILDHNQVLYQLSYTHHALISPAPITMISGAASRLPPGHLIDNSLSRRLRLLGAGARFGHEHGAPVVR